MPSNFALHVVVDEPNIPNELCATIGNVKLLLWPDPNQPNGRLNAITDVFGRWHFGTAPDGNWKCACSINDYFDIEVNIVRPGPDVWVRMKQSIIAAPSISIYGRFFWANGIIWRYVGCSDFALPARFLRGENIIPILKQRVDLGYNVVRSFIYAAPPNTFALDPHSYSSQQLQDFIGLVNDNGLKVELTKGDAQIVLPNQIDQIAHQVMVDSVIGNNFNETCNEPFKNGIDVGIVISHAGIRASGDYNDNTVHAHALDYVTYHGRRDGEGLAPNWICDNVESVLDGFPGYAPMTIPFVHDEPRGFAEVNIPDRRSNDPRKAFLLGDKIGRWLSGGTFHSDQGINSEIFTGLTLSCAKEFARGMNLAPLI